MINKSYSIHAVDYNTKCKNEWLTTACDNINTSYKHNVERQKPNNQSPEYILNDSICKIQK